jgi:hypothetical protein
MTKDVAAAATAVAIFASPVVVVIEIYELFSVMKFVGT